MSAANDEYRPSDDAGADTSQNDYVSRPGQSGISVVKDEAAIDDPVDASKADSDEQLAQDDKDAIDEGNILDSKTRGAGPKGGYQEPGDDEGLGGPDDGASRGA